MDSQAERAVAASYASTVMFLMFKLLFFFTEGPHMLLCKGVTQQLGSQYFTYSNVYLIALFGHFVDLTGQFKKY